MQLKNTVNNKSDLLQCNVCSIGYLNFKKNCEGYVAGSFSDVYECDFCRTQSVSANNENLEGLYQVIYSEPDKLPGYKEYFELARLIKSSKNPLKLLSDTNETYWAAIKVINEQAVSAKANDFSVLEIGTGLGYLTYALNQCGISTLGIDISSNSIEYAREHFGDYYAVHNIYSDGVLSKKFDMVVMCEVIEHVPAPRDFLKAATIHLKEDGVLILTSPNRDIYPDEAVWISEPFPVHLYWYSTLGIKSLVYSLGFNCVFKSLHGFYNREFYCTDTSAAKNIAPILPKKLHSSNLFKSLLNDLAERLSILRIIRNLVRYRKSLTPHIYGREGNSFVLVAKKRKL